MLADFRVVRAESVDHACALLAEHGDGAALYAGGTELILAMKLGLAYCDVMIDLKRIDGYRRMRLRDGTLQLGAGVTHHQIESSTELGADFPALVAMERRVANPRVRRIGTLGGNLAFGEPHSDPSGFLVAAGARLHCRSPAGSRTVAAADFLAGPFETVLEPGELLVGLELPVPGPGTGMGHERLVLTERPEVTVSTRLRLVDGVLAEACVVVGAAGSVPARVEAAERALLGRAPDGDALAAAAAEAGAGAVLDGASELATDYRRHLITVLTRRSLVAALRDLDRH